MRAGGAALALIVLAGAVLRLATLDVQSFSDDELFTVWLVEMSFGDLLSTIPDSEATPPLFYAAEWASARLAGTGEAGMRLLPAVAATVTIPVVYAATAIAASRRAALAAAALTAVNPFLVWYAQDARAYSLLILFVSIGLLALLAYARDGRAGALAGWAVASVAALATHYFALFVVAPEAAWLLLAGGGDLRRRAWAVAAPAAAGLALLPLALHQRSTVSDPGGLGDSLLAERLAAVPKNFLVGFSIPAEAPVSALACVLAAVGLLLALRARGAEGWAGRRAALLTACAVALPLAMAPFGFDYVSSRNVVAALVPLVVALGCGLATSRTGIAALAALCALSTATVIGVVLEPKHQRRDWRGAAEALGPAHTDRVLVFSPPFSNPGPFRVYYGDGSDLLRPPPPRVREVAVVALAEPGGFGPGAPEPPSGPAPAPPRGFRIADDVETETYRLVRYVSERPQPVDGPRLVPLAFPVGRVTLVWQPGGDQ